MEKQRAVYPFYTEHPVFEELVTLAKNAGIEVKYIKKGEGVLAGAMSQPCEYSTPEIHMMVDYDYGEHEYASFVLAHELAHALVNTFYGGAAHHFYPDTEHVRRFIEADADKVGAALYALAEMTANYKGEAIWHSILYHLLAKFIPEDMPTLDEIEAIEAGRREIADGEYVRHDEIDWS